MRGDPAYGQATTVGSGPPSGGQGRIQVLLHRFKQPVGHVLQGVAMGDPGKFGQLLGICDVGGTAQYLTGGVGYEAARLRVNALAEQLHRRHGQPCLLPGLSYGGVLTFLAWLDLSGRELPRELPLGDPAADHEHTAFVNDDGGGDARPLIRVLLRHVCSSRTARMGGKTVSTEMKQGRRVSGDFSVSPPRGELEEVGADLTEWARCYGRPMTLSVPTGHSVDLRVQPVDEVLDRVERSLQTHFDRNTVVRKRRSVGARTDRDTWVRIERRVLSKISDQGWNGIECAARLMDVSQPVWQGSLVWRDADEPAMWRADETELLPGDPIGTAVLSEDPKLSDEWWRAFNTSLDALAAQSTSRVASPDTEFITQVLVTKTIHGVFPSSIDTTVEQWVPAHADLNWANMSAPTFSLFDWEDWGNAPHGLDSASLWASSLAVPALAKRVLRERRAEFASRDGKLMTLFVCSKILGPDAHPQDPRLEPARQMAEQIVQDLQTD